MSADWVSMRSCVQVGICARLGDLERAMQIALEIDDDVLRVATQTAERDHKTVGEVISAMARQAIPMNVRFDRTQSGIPLLPLRPDGGPVTVEMVNQLREEMGE